MAAVSSATPFPIAPKSLAFTASSSLACNVLTIGLNALGPVCEVKPAEFPPNV